MSLAPRLVLLPVIALSLIAAAVVLKDPGASRLFGAGGATVMIVFAVLGTLLHLHRLREAAATDAVADFVADEAAPSFITAADGEILHSNRAAARTFPRVGAGLTALFDGIFASPASVMRRLRTRASGQGSASEDVVTQQGHARLSVHRLPRNRLLWRFEEFSVPVQGANGFDLALITVGRSNSILSMNPAARRLVGARPRSLQALFETLPLRSGETHDLVTATGRIAVRVLQIGETGGRRELVLLPETGGQVERLGGLEDLLSSLPVPILLLDAAGTVELANIPARDMLGPDCHEGAPLSALLEGLGRSLTDWLAEAISGRGPIHSEFLRLSADESETFVQVTLKPIDRGGSRGVIATLSDATELKTLEAQFVQSQKMQAIGQLAGGVAHDFNNLLTAISGHCDLLLLRHDPGDPDYSDLIQINQNANRAASLVGQLLAFSRKQTLRPQVLDLRDTLSDLTHLLNRLVGEKVRLTLSHDPLLRTIRGDKRQLEQVIMNLVVNARDAMPDGGDIRIVTESLRLSEPMKRDRAEVAAGEYVSVKVIDTGRGITPDKLAKVFEPFFTTKRVGEGTGLGLSTAYGIVKQSGGFIFADSEADQGTCFTLLFPVYEARSRPTGCSQKAEGPGARRPGRFAEGVVLLVEDEAPVRAFASQALRLRGYTVLEADSAESALETLNDRDLKVDIFVTDVVMPGLDGPSWVRKALESRPEVRVVFVSGYAEESFGDAQAHIPNSVFLPKPFSLTQLTETVQRQLH
ncbi:ATP-binding protein [Oceanicola sp. 22II-s10i]|uniref:hybrid sensor histidine kinase/response regulator n=1 Tax=Oceanicola sp. 22II-s10i TaxID=1317116 RepID=UPI0020CD7B22|nr:ATP-binding protein [Oceanicola sp. 22II-s10i]